MQTHRLASHPVFAGGAIKGVTLRWGRVADGRIMLRWRVDGGARLVVPPAREPARAEDLWQTTCFEMFLADGEGRYREYNFSPSGEWAAWTFAGYRNRAADHEPVAAPVTAIDSGLSVFTCTVFLDGGELAQASRAAFSAVLDEGEGGVSYWALRHGREKPDFHDPTCFVVPLGPAGGP